MIVYVCRVYDILYDLNERVQTYKAISIRKLYETLNKYLQTLKRNIY